MLSVGQELYAVLSSGHRYTTKNNITITKVGRKWAYAKGIPHDLKIDIATLAIMSDNYGKRGQCYLSQEEYEAEQAIINNWQEFRKKIVDKHSYPDGLTMAQIEEAMQVLGLE